MRGLINHTWSQPCFLCKAYAFLRSQRWPLFISGSLDDAWWLKQTVGMLSLLVQGWFWQVVSMANTNFLSSSQPLNVNFFPSEQVCRSYNHSTNALTAISVFVIWLVSCMPGSTCFVSIFWGGIPGLITQGFCFCFFSCEYQ